MLDEEVTPVETQTGNEGYFHNSHYTEVSLGSRFQQTGKYRSSRGKKKLTYFYNFPLGRGCSWVIYRFTTGDSDLGSSALETLSWEPLNRKPEHNSELVWN